MSAGNNLITINGVAMPQPSVYSWSLQDVSAPDSGRTEDSLMWKNRVSQKRKLKLGWKMKNTDTTAFILQSFNPEYIDVTYFDMQDNQYETRTFYVGDREAPVKYWWVGRHMIETITFDIIER